MLLALLVLVVLLLALIDHFSARPHATPGLVFSMTVTQGDEVYSTMKLNRLRNTHPHGTSTFKKPIVRIMLEPTQLRYLWNTVLNNKNKMEQPALPDGGEPPYTGEPPILPDGGEPPIYIYIHWSTHTLPDGGEPPICI